METGLNPEVKKSEPFGFYEIYIKKKKMRSKLGEFT